MGLQWEGPPRDTKAQPATEDLARNMNTQPVGFRLTGPAFMFETHLAGRPQADRLCFYVDVHTYIRQAGEDEGFVLVPDDDAPPSLTSPATSDSSPPTPPIRPVPGAPEPDPPPDRLPGPPDPLPDRHAEPVTAPLWKKFARWVLRLAFKKRLWAHLGQHLKTLKALGLGAAPGASRRRGGSFGSAPG